MKYIKKVWKSGNSLVITLDEAMLNGKGIKSNYSIEIEIIIFPNIITVQNDQLQAISTQILKFYSIFLFI